MRRSYAAIRTRTALRRGRRTAPGWREPSPPPTI